MLDFLAWWIAAAVLGAAAVPISSRLLHCLPDRGYAAAKPIGLLVAAYLFWIGGSLGLLHNDRGSVVLVVLVLILAGLLLGSRQRREVIRFFREHGRYVLMVEALFLLVFACFALLRTYAPDITSTEKPFELAFLNGVSRTPFFPPTDVWYSGHAMNYYYFGYVNVDLLNRLTGTPVGIGFNLATPLTAALAAVTIFGLAFNLVKALARAPLSTDHRDQRATVVALSAVGLLLLVSSLEGVLEFLDAHGIGAASFYRSLGIQGLPVINSQGIATQTSVWYPNDQWSFWWWWRATRMGSQWNVMEFPFFSFMLADLHPHVMVIPFALLSLTFTWSLFAGEEVLDGGWWRRNPLLFVLFALLLGSLALLNAWDQPTEFLILFLAVLIANARRLGDWSWTVLRDAVLFLLPLVGMAVLLFLPFWLVFQSPDFIAIAPTEVSTVLVPDVREAMALPPLHLLLFWGPMLWLSLTFLLVHTRRTAALALPSRYVTWPLFLACLPPLAWLLVVLIQLGPGGLTAELAARGGDLLTELILTLAVFLAFAALMREALPYRSSTFNVQRSTFPVRSSQFPVLSSPVASRRSPVAVRGSGSLSAQDHEPGEPMDRVEPPLPLGEDWPAAPTPDTRHPTPPPVVFALIAIAVGLLFLLGAELFYVEQATFGQNRHNTVFKFWYQAWILQSIG
ncbi:MAG: DUF2298 domain-containing protein, partial [Dehalococcoidia bacterium]